AAGWNCYAFSVAGDSSGTWQATTSTGLGFEVFVSGKETTPQSSLDAWTGTDKVQTTNSTNLLGTNNNLTILTGLYIDAGVQLPVAADLPRLMRPWSEELLRCMRYYWLMASGSSLSLGLGFYFNAVQINIAVQFPVPMRIGPSLSASSGTNFYNLSANGAND